MKKICVIGSLNVDLTVSVPRFNLPGETIFGTDFKTYPGGKGGNQAVAAAKLGADVTMCGALGDDGNSEVYRGLMKKLGIRDLVRVVPGVPSGVALIEVDTAGENRIVVISGANMKVDPAQLDADMESIMECDVFLLQLEIPLDTIEYIAEKLHAAGKTVILDPAPAPATPLSDRLLASVDYVTPNETELAAISGCPTGTEAEIEAAAHVLQAKGCANVIAKIGARGAMWGGADGMIRVPGFKVKAVDTTAAGDSFNAGFAVGLAEGKSVSDAIRFANAVGALSTTAVGAQGAMPSYAQAEALMSSAGK